VGEFAVNPADPPTQYADASFDLVYALSVFTHLPEAMQFAWLRELARITQPGGYLLLTTHGPSLFDRLPESDRAAALGTGFAYIDAGGTDGLPDFYQTAFHTPEYVQDTWSEFFEIVEIVEQGVDNHQDIVVCRKREQTS
jgi:SAM-dependent methyltransferase